MTTDYRALCDELKDAYAWCLEECMRVSAEEDTLIQRARAALAQPEPEEPTDDKLMDIARATNLVYYMGKDRGFASPYMEETDITAEVLAFAREVLARYGRSTFNSTEA